MLLLTYSYPFGKGEEFLEIELELLSEIYDGTIQIIPSSLNGTCRTIATNCEVIRVDDYTAKKPLRFKDYQLIIKIFLLEIFSSKDRWEYLRRFRYYLSYLKNAVHKADVLESVIRENRLVYSYWFDDRILLFSILKARGIDFRLITRGHGGDVYEYQHKEENFIFPFRIFQLNSLNHISTISFDAKVHLIQRYGKKWSDKISVSRLGVKQLTGCANLNRSDFFTIVSCSNFHFYKRIPFLIEVLKLVDCQIKWCHLGGGGDDFEIVQNEIVNLPKNISVNLLGYLSRDEISQFYKENKIDLFVNVSESEGIPVSIMESISIGIPVLGPDVGGISEIITSDTGVLFDPNLSSLELSKILVEIIDGERTLPNKSTIIEFWKRSYSLENFNLFFKNVLCVE